MVNRASNAPNCTASIVACAPVYLIDAALNVPMAVTPYPAGLEMFAGGSGTPVGMNTGTSPNMVMDVIRNEGGSNCCGQFGQGQPTGSDTQFGMMETAIGVGSSLGFVGTGNHCTSVSQFCTSDDEWEDGDFGNTTDNLAPGQVIIESDLISAGTAITTKYNNSTVFSQSTAHTPNLGGIARVGMIMNRFQTLVYFYGGLISHDTSDHTAAYNNLHTFYTSRTPTALLGPLDLNYSPDYFQASSPPVIGNGVMGYSCGRLLSVSYTGYLCQLADSASSPTPNVQSFAAVNGALDPAAATFRAANPPCRVMAVYFQGQYNSQTGQTGNVYDTAMTIVPPSLATAPTVSFSGSGNTLNGFPTIHFVAASSQALCTRTATGTNGWVPNPSGGFGAVAAVARRTSGTAHQAIFGWRSLNHFIGFFGSNVAGTGNTGASIMSGAATDGHWHAFTENQAFSTSTTSAFYVDSASVAISSSAVFGFGHDNICMGGDPSAGANDYLTGDVAEIEFLVAAVPGTPKAGTLDLHSTLFSNYQGFWGTLPN